jgi:hypothetical protein
MQRAAKRSREWDDDQIRAAWSEESTDRCRYAHYHVDFAVKRALGSKLGVLKEKAA